MPFQKGESGNPAGRPRGARNRTTVLLENLLAEDGEAIARKAIELAKAGEIAALRMCLDRLVPVRKDEPVVFDLPPLETAADSVAAAARIVAAVADGDLTPSEAMDVAKVIDVYVGALATKGFEQRLAKLESAANRSRPAPTTAPAHASIAMLTGGCRKRWAIVSGLLFTMKRPTTACGSGSAVRMRPPVDQLL